MPTKQEMIDQFKTEAPEIYAAMQFIDSQETYGEGVEMIDTWADLFGWYDTTDENGMTATMRMLASDK